MLLRPTEDFDKKVPFCVLLALLPRYVAPSVTLMAPFAKRLKDFQLNQIG